MTPLKKTSATADLQVQDDGSVLLTVNAVDSDGEPTTWPSGAPAPTGGEIDPSGFTGPFFSWGTPVATSTGYTLTGTVNQSALTSGAALPTGITVTATIASGFTNQTAPITVNASPLVDLVPGPASTIVASASA